MAANTETPVAEPPKKRERPRYRFITTFEEFNDDYPKPVYPKPEGRFEYGTAGFRYHSSLMPTITARMGILAGLRSKFLEGKCTGIVITASHNPIEDNGVKIVDSDGSMLVDEWEPVATELANCPDDEMDDLYKDIIKRFNINMDFKGLVYIGHDNRPTREQLLLAAKHGVLFCQNIDIRDKGLSATPEIHWMVDQKNNNKKHSVDAYWDSIAVNFRAISYTFEKPCPPDAKRPPDPVDNGRYIGTLWIDGANGVSGTTACMFRIMLIHHMRISVDNDSKGDPKVHVLNLDCGADYVKVNNCPPIRSTASLNDRCCSFDGDADRIVYYYTDENRKFHLLDGDKIAVLIMEFIMERLAILEFNDLKVGVVQTAYSNGAATKYLKGRGIEVVCTKTGVKYLHRRAKDFDVGVYFEANGHGTVVYSERAIEMITNARNVEEALARKACEERGHEIMPPFYRVPMLLPGSHATKMYHFMMCGNHTVGDAAANMCLVELVLKTKEMTIQDWEAQFEYFPTRLSKVKISDRSSVKTFDEERQVSEPSTLQPAINALVAQYNEARSFVRPSGTEDAIRVFAEAATQEEADHLAARVCCTVYDLCGGVGDRPEEPAPLAAKAE